ncbi:MAG: efflux RND transporter periplasmic adaptor subunit [Bacteroidales bacterium]|nr:efflux RND transporter periplasmic adaptor subunit [Bacteroidales bacterium]
MTTKKYVYAFAGIVILAIILYVIFGRSKQQDDILALVKSGSFPIEITTTGELIAKSSEKIYGPQALRQIRIYQVKIDDIIADGSVVDSGQYIASLDRSEITNRIKDEEANVEKYESQLITSKLDTSLELRNARDELINLQYSLEEKKIALEQSKYEPPATIRQVQIELEKTERALSQAEKNYQLKLEKAVAKMNEVNAEYNKAQRKLTEMTDVLEQFTVRAPKSGMVIYRRNWDGSKMGVGSTISAWDPVVAELPDLSKMISKTYVNEIDISKVKTGQPVSIGIDAFPDKQFTGTVTEVANIGEQLQGTNAKVFEVKILINEYDSILRPAMTTKNTILTATIDSVLFIPLEAVFNNDSISFVYKKTGGLIKQQVILGQSNYNEIIVKEGLSQGDEILLIPPEKEENLKLNALSEEVLEKYRAKPDSLKTILTTPAGLNPDSVPVKRREGMQGKGKPGGQPSGNRMRRQSN